MTSLPIDIIVPVYNSPEWVRPCLRSIARNTDVPYRLIVVDDASDAYTRGLLRDLCTEHQLSLVLYNEENVGFVKACNIGMRASKSPYLVLLNSDALVPPGWLGKLRSCIESDAQIGIANPLSNDAANLSIPLPPGCNYLGMAEGLAKLRTAKYPDIVTAVGFCIMLGKQMLDEIGYFDEIYDRGYCEETDLCLRAMKAGWRVVACDDLYVFHRGAATFLDGNERYRKNLRIFLQRHGALYREAYDRFVKAAPLKNLLAQVSEPPPVRWRRWASIGRTIVTDLAGAHPFRAWRHFKEGQLTPQFHKSAARYKPFWRLERPSVTFLFDSLESYGGVISVLKVVNGLIEKGFEVRVVSLTTGRGLLKGLYTAPMHFGSVDNLIKGVGISDIFISTFWVTAYWLPKIRARFPKARLISYIQDYESWFEPMASNLARRVVESYSIPDALITTSTWLYSKLGELGKDSFVIPKGVDGDIFRVLENEPPEPMSVLAMARPHTPHRGFRNIVGVFRSLHRRNPSVKLYFFGCDDRALGSLDFPFHNYGMVENGASLARIYNRHTVYLDASKFQGFGMMGLEAMACGTACILTSIGGINEYAKDRDNCRLIHPEDVEGTATAVQELIDNASLRSDLVRRGLETTAEFSLERETKSFSQLLQEVL